MPKSAKVAEAKRPRGRPSGTKAKRPAPSAVEEEEPPTKRPRGRPRRSGRISDVGQKSSYFEGPDDGEENDDEVDDDVRAKKGKTNGRVSATAKAGTTRGRRKSAPVVEEVEDEYEEEEDEVEDEDEVDDEDDDDEKVPPRSKVTIVKVPKLRPEGDTPYSDDTVHANTMLFLRDLKANNRRVWLKANDGEFRRAAKDWESFVMSLTRRLGEVDFTIPELPPRDVIFRIYRDTRFSKNPTPYKPHFSAAWSRTGRKGPYACYYVHAEPGNCFVGGGLWHPENDNVVKLRRSIDERPRRWRRVLNDPGLKRTFFPAAAKSSDPEKVLEAFAERNKENALKKRPQGYHPEHRDLQLLKIKNYTVSSKVADNVVFGPGSQDNIVGMFRDMSGFVTFLNSVVMPDPNMSDDESDEDEDGEDQEDEEGEEDEEQEDDQDDQDDDDEDEDEE